MKADNDNHELQCDSCQYFFASNELIRRGFRMLCEECDEYGCRISLPGFEDAVNS